MNTKVLNKNNYYGVCIRKNLLLGNKALLVSKKNLKKQILTLYKKLLKKQPDIFLEYSIEKNYDLGYHAHLIVYNIDTKILFDSILSFISADNWSLYVEAYDTYYKCSSSYGSASIHTIYDLLTFKRYISKEMEPFWLYPL